MCFSDEPGQDAGRGKEAADLRVASVASRVWSAEGGAARWVVGTGVLQRVLGAGAWRKLQCLERLLRRTLLKIDALGNSSKPLSLLVRCNVGLTRSRRRRKVSTVSEKRTTLPAARVLERNASEH